MQKRFLKIMLLVLSFNLIAINNAFAKPVKKAIPSSNWHLKITKDPIDDYKTILAYREYNNKLFQPIGLGIACSNFKYFVIAGLGDYVDILPDNVSIQYRFDEGEVFEIDDIFDLKNDLITFFVDKEFVENIIKAKKITIRANGYNTVTHSFNLVGAQNSVSKVLQCKL